MIENPKVGQKIFAGVIKNDELKIKSGKITQILPGAFRPLCYFKTENLNSDGQTYYSTDHTWEPFETEKQCAHYLLTKAMQEITKDIDELTKRREKLFQQALKIAAERATPLNFAKLA